jgi:hypothetical protein
MPNFRTHKPKPGASTQVDPGGMKKAFGTPVGSTKLDEEPEEKPKDEGGGLGSRITRGIRKRIGS